MTWTWQSSLAVVRTVRTVSSKARTHLGLFRILFITEPNIFNNANMSTCLGLFVTYDDVSWDGWVPGAGAGPACGGRRLRSEAAGGDAGKGGYGGAAEK